jgi:hypothetical protein
VDTPAGWPLPAGADLGLQMVRTDGPLGIGRATAREGANGYSGDWTLTSSAVCAKPLGSIHAETDVAPRPLDTILSHSCGANEWTRGIGGGGALTDGGPVWLRTLAPVLDGTNLPKGVVVGMTGPLAPAIGGVGVLHSCALGN